MKRFDLSNTDRRFLLGAGVAVASVVIVVVGLIAVVSSLGGDDVHLPGEGSLGNILGDIATPVATGDSPGASPILVGSIPGSLPTGPRPERIDVPRLTIDARVVTMGLEPGTNIPAVPKDGGLVAWYDFSPPPNLNNNAVFTGHVDWQTEDGRPLPGVFYRLRELQIGDDINVRLDDGNEVRYVVTGNVATEYDDPNVVRAMQPTAKDVITIITCGGSWVNDGSTDAGGNYTHRIIVRAEKAPAAAAALSGS